MDRQRLQAMKTVSSGYIHVRVHGISIQNGKEGKPGYFKLIHRNISPYCMSSLQNHHTFLVQRLHSSYIK